MTRPHLARLAVPALLALVGMLAPTPTWSQEVRFRWDAGGTLATSYSLGDLADRTFVAPGDAGADDLLTRTDLEATGAAYSAQGVLMTELESAVRVEWVSDFVDLEIGGTLLARYSPQGFSGQAGFAVAPGETGVRVVRRPERWGDGRLAVDIGRLRLGESSGRVVDQLADGAGFAVRFPTVYASLHVGVTSLVSPYFFTPRLIAEDTVDESALTAPDRLIAVARLEFAELGEHALGVFAVYYDDRRPATGSDSYFAGLTGTGTIVSDAGVLARLEHRSSFALQWTTQQPGPGLLADVAVRARGVIPLIVDLEASYASGAGGTLARFMPVTPIAVGRVVAVPLSDLITVGLEVGFDPDEREPFKPAVRADLFLSATGADRVFGSELAAHLEYGLLPDLKIRADAGAAWSPLGWTPIVRVEGRVTL